MTLESDLSKIVVYGGRFQPFHLDHFNRYTKLVQEFGKDSVYIATQNKIEVNSPLSFEEKKYIINRLFPEIPSNRIVFSKKPYNPLEILNNFQPNKNILIVCLGMKDKNRINHDEFLSDRGYFELYTEVKTHLPFESKAYIYLLDNEYKISATEIRNILKNDNDGINLKKKKIEQIYDGRFDEDVFDLLSLKIK